MPFCTFNFQLQIFTAKNCVDFWTDCDEYYHGYKTTIPLKHKEPDLSM